MSAINIFLQKVKKENYSLTLYIFVCIVIRLHVKANRNMNLMCFTAK